MIMTITREKILKALETMGVDDSQFRIQQRVPEYTHKEFPKFLNPSEDSDDLVEMIVLDTETTGLDRKNDEIIELAMIKLEFNKTQNNVHRILSTFDQYREPQYKNISKTVTSITGITPQQVSGKSIDENEVLDFIGDTKYIVAHNASFDMDFFDQFESINKEDYSWLCTMRDVDWRNDYGMESSRIVNVLIEYGYFYRVHSALTDCFAVVQLMESSGCMEKVFESADQESFSVYALKSPFDCKDQLKSSGFRWDPDRRSWYKSSLSEEQVVDALKKLDELYNGAGDAEITKLNGNQRLGA